MSGVADAQTNRLNAYLGYYDGAGNILRDAGNNYAYNADNLLKQATSVSDGSQLGNYRYDALGRRVKKSWNYNGSAGYTSYIYGVKGEILAEYQSDWFSLRESFVGMDIQHLHGFTIDRQKDVRVFEHGRAGVAVGVAGQNQRQGSDLPALL